MEIIIRSRENGWETERRLELPEDVGLVKSILRTLGGPRQSGTLCGERRSKGAKEALSREDGATEAGLCDDRSGGWTLPNWRGGRLKTKWKNSRRRKRRPLCRSSRPMLIRPPTWSGSPLRLATGAF